MSIQEIVSVIQQIAETPPSQADPNYWAFRLRGELHRCHQKPINRPMSDETQANIRAYWQSIFPQEK